MKSVALEVIKMEDGLYGSKRISNTVGGCAMNTSRAANFYIQALLGNQNSLVKTLGSIGKDQAGEYIMKQLQDENM
jgi:sugar/nucleoside kinase (ribokinase family)